MLSHGISGRTARRVWGAFFGKIERLTRVGVACGRDVSHFKTALLRQCVYTHRFKLFRIDRICLNNRIRQCDFQFNVDQVIQERTTNLDQIHGKFSREDDA